jgi:hypothetical protein
MINQNNPLSSVSFNDGYVQGIEIKNSKIVQNVSKPVSFGFKTVGYTHFYRASMADVTVDKVIVIPIYNPIDCNYVELHSFRDNAYGIYKVVQRQDIFSDRPPFIRLSLEKVKNNFIDERESA